MSEIIEGFAEGWDRISPRAPWRTNPAVWVVRFERVERSMAPALPILFSGPMVCAILAGRKTETRRLASRRYGFGAPGTLLWVREAWQPADLEVDGASRRPPFPAVIAYRADLAVARISANGRVMEPVPVDDSLRRWLCGSRWSPSIHMRRYASRIILRVRSVHQELLQDITDSGVRAEGFGEVG